MTLSPSQILSVNRSGGAASRSRSRSETDPVRDALAQDPEPERGESLFQQIRGAAGHTVMGVGRTLDLGRAVLVAGGGELGDVLRDVAGKETFGTKGGASFEDFKANVNRRIGVGDMLEENTATKGLPMNVKRGLGLLGDIAIDPLNAVAGGVNTAARLGTKKVGLEGGEDVAKILTREGPDAADSLLARNHAARQADAAAEYAARQADEAAPRFGQQHLFEDATTAVPPMPRPAILDAPAPTVRSILAEGGVAEEAVDRVLGNISRTGQGGIRFADRTLVKGETLGAMPGAQALKAGGQAFKQTGTGKALRTAATPYTRTRDKFGDSIASRLSTLGHQRGHYIAKNMQIIDGAIVKSGALNIDQAARGQIVAALDVNGLDLATTRASLAAEGLDDAVDALDTLVVARDRSYNELLRAGVDPQDLMSKDEYLRHSLTPEGAEALGIDPDLFKAGKTKTGAGPERKRPDSITDQNAEFGFDAYKSDPVELVRASADHAYTVGGNRLLFDALDDLAAKTGKQVTSKTAKPGYTKIAPNAYIHDTIYEDVLNLRKAGADNSIVKSWDAFTGILKRHVLFGPVAFGPYFMQNMGTGLSLNTARFGVRPRHYGRTDKLMRAIKESQGASVTKFISEGDHFDDALRAALPDPDDYAVGKKLWDSGLVDPAGATYDDLATVARGAIDDTKAAKASRFGTNNTVKINAYGEEMLRGSAFVKAIEDGIDPAQAAKLVRDTHIDYSALGKTAFERNAISRFIFFPSWLIRAPKAIISTYMQKPGVAMGQMRLEQGTHWYDREKNDYGDVLGPRLSGPGTFMTGLLAGDEVPESGGELLNPLARAIMDSGARDLDEIIPPLAQVGRAQGLIDDEPHKRERYAKSLGGVRTGVDYSGERAVESLNERIAEREKMGGTATPIQTLAMRAVDIIGPEAADMRTGDLVRALIGEGVPTAEIRRILNAPYKSVERQARPSVNVDRLLAEGRSVEEISELLRAG